MLETGAATSITASAGRLLSALAFLDTPQRVRTVADMLARYTAHDDAYYRAHYTYTAANSVVRPFEEVRAAYLLGHLAAFSAESGEVWEELEPSLADTWALADPAEWNVVRDFALSAYRRASSLDYLLWRSRAFDVEDAAEAEVISPDPDPLMRWRGHVGDEIHHHPGR